VPLIIWDIRCNLVLAKCSNGFETKTMAWTMVLYSNSIHVLMRPGSPVFAERAELGGHAIGRHSRRRVPNSTLRLACTSLDSTGAKPQLVCDSSHFDGSSEYFRNYHAIESLK
jgi:hypothetical protein